MHAFKKHPLSVLMATFFGVGFIPGAPGTYGAIACLPLLWFAGTLDWPIRLGLFVTTLIASVVWSDRAGKAFGEKDCQNIVIDEVVGVWIALVWLPEPTLAMFAVALVAFRLFDITKPWPISWLDENIDGGLGVVLDDVAAGLAAALVVVTAFLILNGL